MRLRIPKFHPLSDMPLFESQRTLRGHPFYPGASVLRSLAPREPRLPAEGAPCVVYHSPWGHLVVTEIHPENLNGYGWTCLSNDPDGAEWGDLGYMGEFERRRGTPYEFWERDLHSQDRNAAAAIARILTRYDDPSPRRSAPAGPEPARAVPAEAATHPTAAPVARMPRTPCASAADPRQPAPARTRACTPRVAARSRGPPYRRPLSRCGGPRLCSFAACADAAYWRGGWFTQDCGLRTVGPG